MITYQVIKEIYKKFKKPVRDQEELQLGHYMDLLKSHHNLTEDDMEVVLEDLEEFNPFKRFLKRSIYAILELDNMIAFVFRTHILFFGLEDNQLRVHIKPEEPKSFFSRIFGKDE